MMYATRVSSMTYQLYRVLRAHPLLDSPLMYGYGYGTRFMSSEVRKRLSILSRSTLFLQDGVSISELPILIRRLDKTLIPVVNNKLSMDDVQKMSQHDQMFKMKLQECSTAKDVFRLLEIPADQVTAYTAAFALVRLCQLRNSRNSEFETIHSFIRTAVLNELCDTVVRDVVTLTNETLIKMLGSTLSAESLPEQTVEVLLLEVERRLGDSLFDMTELSEVLCHVSADRSHSDLVDLIHVHIGERVSELDVQTCARVFQALSKMKTPNTKSTLKLLETPVMKFWWLLKSEDTAQILTSLVHLNFKSVRLMSAFAKLVFLNIQSFNVGQLKKVIYAYIHFNFINAYLFKALEKYVIAKNTSLDIKIAALVMEYCRTSRFLSLPIFETVSTHVRARGHEYTANELFLVLRPFGYLNYLPSSAGALFEAVEKHLAERFDDFSPEKILELLASFAYIERFPINFVKKIFTPYMFSLVNNISVDSIKDDACRNLLKLQSAVSLERRDCRIPYQYSYDLFNKWTEQVQFRMMFEIKETLVKMLPDHDVQQNVILDRFPYTIDFAIGLRADASVSLHNTGSSQRVVAMVMTSPRDVTVNTGTPLGDHAMKLRLLRHRGFHVVEFPQSGYVRSDDRERYLRRLLEAAVRDDSDQTR